jgi:DNA-binding MarR family transcriptional regulator
MTLTNRRRDTMIGAIVTELSAWKPRERTGMFRRWLKGSLSIVHLHVLTILEDEGPLPMGKLAESLDVSVASATGIVDRMEQRGLVERRHDANDRRVVLVHPTEAGLAVFTDLEEHRRAMLATTLALLSNDELKSFLVGLRAMSRARAELTVERVADTGPARDLVAVRVRRGTPEAAS